MMNRVIMIGRLTKDPELRYLPSSGTACTSFSLAVKEFRNKQEVTQFFRCVAFGKIGENLAQYQTKGNLIAIEGKLSNGSYEAKDGTKRYTTEIIANDIKYLTSKSNGTGSGESYAENEWAAMEQNYQDNGEMPF